MAHHRDEPEPVVGHVDVSVLALRGAVHAAHELREDPPGLDAADDVDPYVAVERRADVVGPHGGRDSHRGGLVPAPGVEASGDLPLLVEDVAALLDAAGGEEMTVDAEEVLAVEAELLHLRQRADRFCFPGDRHSRSHSSGWVPAEAPNQR